MARGKDIYTFPQLHNRVAEAVAATLPSIHFNRREGLQPTKQYPTNIMGHFICNLPTCRNKSWASKKVCIVIRSFEGNGYDAQVFGQQCKCCKKLGRLVVDKEAYVERVSYRLLKWARARVERPPFNKKKGAPHKAELCEGCKRGFCDWEASVAGANE